MNRSYCMETLSPEEWESQWFSFAVELVESPRKRFIFIIKNNFFQDQSIQTHTLFILKTKALVKTHEARGKWRQPVQPHHIQAIHPKELLNLRLLAATQHRCVFSLIGSSYARNI